MCASGDLSSICCAQSARAPYPSARCCEGYSLGVDVLRDGGQVAHDLIHQVRGQFFCEVVGAPVGEVSISADRVEEIILSLPRHLHRHLQESVVGLALKRSCVQNACPATNKYTPSSCRSWGLHSNLPQSRAVHFGELKALPKCMRCAQVTVRVRMNASRCEDACGVFKALRGCLQGGTPGWFHEKGRGSCERLRKKGSEPGGTLPRQKAAWGHLVHARKRHSRAPFAVDVCFTTVHCCHLTMPQLKKIPGDHASTSDGDT
eukprot:1160219-Pelagomonas_calceolata.AAC.3